LIQLDARQIQTLNQIRLHQPEFQPLLAHWLAQVTNQMIVTDNSEKLHALRGEARAIGDLLAAVQESQAAFERLETARRQAR
jgi:hypothetical protein